MGKNDVKPALARLLRHFCLKHLANTRVWQFAEYLAFAPPGQCSTGAIMPDGA
jgi:hypothetical protein